MTTEKNDATGLLEERAKRNLEGIRKLQLMQYELIHDLEKTIDSMAAQKDVRS